MQNFVLREVDLNPPQKSLTNQKNFGDPSPTFFSWKIDFSAWAVGRFYTGPIYGDALNTMYTSQTENTKTEIEGRVGDSGLAMMAVAESMRVIDAENRVKKLFASQERLRHIHRMTAWILANGKCAKLDVGVECALGTSDSEASWTWEPCRLFPRLLQYFRNHNFLQ